MSISLSTAAIQEALTEEMGFMEFLVSTLEPGTGEGLHLMTMDPQGTRADIAEVSQKIDSLQEKLVRATQLDRAALPIHQLGQHAEQGTSLLTSVALALLGLR